MADNDYTAVRDAFRALPDRQRKIFLNGMFVEYIAANGFEQSLAQIFHHAVTQFEFEAHRQEKNNVAYLACILLHLLRMGNQINELFEHTLLGPEIDRLLDLLQKPEMQHVYNLMNSDFFDEAGDSGDDLEWPDMLSDQSH